MPLQAQVLSIQDDCERSHVRHHLRLPVQGAAIAGNRALLHNLSETGLLIETFDDLAVGEGIQVDLPEAGGRSAKVVWRSDRLFGCQFEQPIAHAAISAARLRSPPSTSLAEPTVVPAPQEDTPARRHGAYIDSAGVPRLPLRTRFLVIVGFSVLSWAAVGIPIALLALS
jgi:hypothetical protein